MTCRSGCPTPGAHASWGACARAGRISVQWLGGASGFDLGTEKAFNKENDNYAQAVKDGLDPVSVSNVAIEKAYREADVL